MMMQMAKNEMASKDLCGKPVAVKHERRPSVKSPLALVQVLTLLTGLLEEPAKQPSPLAQLAHDGRCFLEKPQGSIQSEDSNCGVRAVSEHAQKMQDRLCTWKIRTEKGCALQTPDKF